MSRAVSVIVRRGRRARPAITQPSQSESTAMIGERDRGVDEQLVQRGIRLPLRRGERDLAVGGERVRADRYRERVAGCPFWMTSPVLWTPTTACWPELMKKVPRVLVVDEDVGDREQGGAERGRAAVDQREAQPDRRAEPKPRRRRAA